MTRRDISVRRTSALSVLFLGLAFPVSSRGAPVETGVAWAFEGTVSGLTADFSVCCELAWGLGDRVTGTLSYLGPPSIPGLVTGLVEIDVPGTSSVVFGDDAHTISDGDGTSGSPDVASFGAPAFGPIATLQPGWSTGPFQPFGKLFLVDDDGTAWSGINPRTGSVLPDYAPDASLFERAEITLLYHVVGPIEDVSGTITIHIDRFPVPEPSIGALGWAALVALAALRSSAARSPKSRRACARRDSAARVTRG